MFKGNHTCHMSIDMISIIAANIHSNTTYKAHTHTQTHTHTHTHTHTQVSHISTAGTHTYMYELKATSLTEGIHVKGIKHTYTPKLELSISGVRQ